MRIEVLQYTGPDPPWGCPGKDPDAPLPASLAGHSGSFMAPSRCTMGRYLAGMSLPDGAGPSILSKVLAEIFFSSSAIIDSSSTFVSA